jgi:hypothetical protein
VLDVFRIAIGLELDLVGTAEGGDLVVGVFDVECLDAEVLPRVGDAGILAGRTSRSFQVHWLAKSQSIAECSMALAEEDIRYIKQHLGEWLAEQSLGKPPAVYEIELRERMVRVEEELKHQRELMRQGFEQMDKRFEQVDKRFEQVDKRFDEMLKRHDKHFLWLIGFIATSAGLVIAAIRFF